MKNIILPILFLLSYSHSSAQGIEYEHYWGDMRVRGSEAKGKVKSLCLSDNESIGEIIDSRYFKFDENGQIIEYFINDTMLMSRNTYKYNNEGKLIERIAVNPHSIRIEKSFYEYDEKGRLSSSRLIFEKNGIDHPIWETKLTYDQKGNLIDEKIHGINSIPMVGQEVFDFPAEEHEIIHIYDERDQLIEDDCIDSNSNHNWHFKTSYKYDDKGKIIDQYSAYGKIFSTWDKNGSQVDTFYNFKGGHLDSIDNKSIIKYDSNHNEIEQLVFKGGNSLSYKRMTQYKYDQMGNWIEKKEFNNGKLKTTAKRKIEYYK